jgi:hypothetical protein
LPGSTVHENIRQLTDLFYWWGRSAFPELFA